jgi:hypothetical protein
MAEELLEKIPPERRWEITSKILSRFMVLRGEESVAPLLGKGEGIISPIWGAEKWQEIHIKVFGDGGKHLFPMFKEMFNLPVENAIDADNLVTVVATLMNGPENTPEVVEATPERVVGRIIKCTWMERYKECDIDRAFIPCVHGDQAWGEEGLKAVNPKISYKITKAMPLGDPYCESIVEFKEE